MLEGVTFTFSFRRHADRLELGYRIFNGRSDEVAVLDQIRGVGIDGAPDYAPGAVYVDLEGPLLRLTKGTLPVPEGVFPGVYPIPDARLIAAGASREQRFDVPVPVKVCNPFRRRGHGQVVAAREAVAREVLVGVGVVPSGKSCAFTRSNPAFPDVVSVLWLEARPGVQLDCQTIFSERFPLDEDLPVLDYEGFPWP